METFSHTYKFLLPVNSNLGFSETALMKNPAFNILKVSYNKTIDPTLEKYFLDLNKRLKNLNNKAKKLSSKKASFLKKKRFMRLTFPTYLYDDNYKSYTVYSFFPFLTPNLPSYSSLPDSKVYNQLSNFKDPFLNRFEQYRSLCEEYQKIFIEVTRNSRLHRAIRFGGSST